MTVLRPTGMQHRTRSQENLDESGSDGATAKSVAFMVDSRIGVRDNNGVTGGFSAPGFRAGEHCHPPCTGV